MSYRGIVNVYQKHREMAPIVHDVLAEFGWLADTALTHAAETKGAFPEEEGSSLSVRQARLAPTDAQTLVPKQVKYDRHIDCRREGSVDGGTLGPALAGPLARVRNLAAAISLGSLRPSTYGIPRLAFSCSCSRSVLHRLVGLKRRHVDLIHSRSRPEQRRCVQG